MQHRESFAASNRFQLQTNTFVVCDRAVVAVLILQILPSMPTLIYFLSHHTRGEKEDKLTTQTRLCHTHHGLCLAISMILQMGVLLCAGHFQHCNNLHALDAHVIGMVQAYTTGHQFLPRQQELLKAAEKQQILVSNRYRQELV